ncbi:MAG: YbaB/EbfC family nucleoid-associated protein [Alphaproteobacteria bacterium]|jgi:DNA-binding YbaB/EbfC family protein|nr:YbaB/EbfC family nucleoid-associated protein [Alphaproteobacteria bacterium]
MANIMQMMKKAQELQNSMSSMQNEIKELTFDTTSGGGLVKMTMNGNYDIISIEIDDSIIDVAEKVLITDLIVACYNDLRRKVQEETEKRMKELTAGLPIPPGMKIPGLF